MFLSRAKVACAILSIGLSVMLWLGGGSVWAGLSLDSSLRAECRAEGAILHCVWDAKIPSEAKLRHGPVTTIASGTTAGGTLTAEVENIAPPTVGDDSASATVVIKINGWPVYSPKLSWNPETQTWGFSYVVPVGMSGADITVIVTNNSTGASGSTTVTVL